MLNKLTAKQENFCKAIALKQKNQSDAYRMAYDTKTTNKRTIQKEVDRLMQDPRINPRINHLKKTLTEETIKKFTKSREDILLKLESLITKAEDDKTEITASVSINQVRECLKEQGKLLGYYEDTLNLKGDANNPLADSYKVTEERISEIIEQGRENMSNESTK